MSETTWDTVWEYSIDPGPLGPCPSTDVSRRSWDGCASGLARS